MGRSLTSGGVVAAGADGGAGAVLAVTLGVVALLALLALLAAGVRGRGGAARAAAERVRVRALTARLEALGDLTGAGVLVRSSDGRVVELGERAADLLGVRVADAVGRPVADLPLTLVDEAGRRVHPGAVLGAVGARGSAAGSPGALVVGVGAPGAGLGGGLGGGAVPSDPSEPVTVVRRVRVETRPLPALPGEPGALLVAITEVGGAGGDRSGVALHEAAQVAPVALALADRTGRVREANRAFASLAGAGLEALPDVDLGDPGRDLIGRTAVGTGTRAGPGRSTTGHDGVPSTPGGIAGARGWHDAVAALASGTRPRVALEQRWTRPDGPPVSVVLDLALVPGGPDVAVVARDVTADREASDSLTHRALHDPLTGLANRALLLGTLQEALERPGADDRLAVLACDLDGFKPINDRFGHAAGDDVLVHVAGVLRAATGARGTVARLGGDEFVILLEAADSARAAQEVAGAIHAGLREPVRIQRHRVPVRASVGVALGSSPTPSPGAPGLLAAADAALYRAKGGGRSRTEVYDPAVDHDGAPGGLAAELAGALDRGEIVVHLQPVVDLADGHVVGDEALVRWRHPERGLLPPAVFGSAVPEAGMTAALTRHLLGRAVDHLARTSGSGRWVAVDVAVELLGDGELVRALLAELAARGAQPGRLVVELGGAALDDVAHRVRVDLAALRSAGVRVVLDRFGAGLPPLASLRDLPLDGLKLDPSYTSGVVDDPAAARVARGVAALARELDLMTVADGVDTVEQAQVLREAGWRYAQGWASGGPEPSP